MTFIENFRKNTLGEESYYRMLLGQYRLISDDRRGIYPEAIASIETVIRKQEETGKVSWEDLYAMDKALAKVLTKAELVYRYPFVIDMYREVAGEKNYASRVIIKGLDFSTVDEESLRSEIEEVIDDLYRHLALYSACRKSRNNIMKAVVCSLLAAYVVFIGFMIRCNGELAPIFYVMVAGSIGGMIGMTRRIQNSTGIDTNALSYLDLKYDKINIYLAPMYGAIFSVLLFLFFTAGFIKGDLFPIIESMDSDTAGASATVSEVMSNFVAGTFPNSGIECAKLIIWSFIAGFAEKFVPDALDRLVSRSTKPNGK